MAMQAPVVAAVAVVAVLLLSNPFSALAATGGRMGGRAFKPHSSTSSSSSSSSSSSQPSYSSSSTPSSSLATPLRLRLTIPLALHIPPIRLATLDHLNVRLATHRTRRRPRPTTLNLNRCGLRRGLHPPLHLPWHLTMTTMRRLVPLPLSRLLLVLSILLSRT